MQKVRSVINQNGFSLVEALLSASIFGVLVTAVIGGIAYGHEAALTSSNRSHANRMAEEGTEAVRNIRDSAYSNIPDGTYGLIKSSNQWTLSGSQDTNGIFTRQIIISTPTANSKQVVSRVTWQQGPKNFQAESITTLTNWLGPLTFSGNWTAATYSNALDLTGALDGTKVATRGNYAYVIRADGTPDFMIVDITNPAAPVARGTLSLSGVPTNLFVKGDYVYISANDTSTATTLGIGELKIINVSNPLAPSVVGSLNLAGTAAAQAIFVSGDYAYMGRIASTTTGSNEFQIINVANPASPNISGLSAGEVNSASFMDIYVSGNVAYAATTSDNQELFVVNISNPASLVSGTHRDLSTTANVTATDGISIAGYGTNIFVTQGNTFHVLTTETPLAPTARSKIALTGNGNDISTNKAESLVYAATAGTSALLQPNNEFQVVNVSNPAAPSVVSSIDLPDLTVLPINGVAYSITKNRVFGVTGSDTQEFLVFRPN